jgi:hypothetical protein
MERARASMPAMTETTMSVGNVWTVWRWGVGEVEGVDVGPAVTAVPGVVEVAENVDKGVMLDGVTVAL